MGGLATQACGKTLHAANQSHNMNRERMVSTPGLSSVPVCPISHIFEPVKWERSANPAQCGVRLPRCIQHIPHISQTISQISHIIQHNPTTVWLMWEIMAPKLVRGRPATPPESPASGSARFARPATGMASRWLYGSRAHHAPAASAAGGDRLSPDTAGEC